MKKFTCFALSVLLSLSFCIPAAAAEDYGVIYDETEQLGSESLQHAGEVTLPALTEQYGVDLRVDILTKSDYDTVFDAAEGIYEKYGYGYGEYHSGITRPCCFSLMEMGIHWLRMTGVSIWAVRMKICSTGIGFFMILPR